MTKLTQLSLDGEGGRRRIHLREISGDSEAPLETVGQDLRAARLRRGEDLATVSRALKIRKEHLEAVEDDRVENLPGKTYAIGFVRSYAAYLGLDSNQMVERFKEEISGRHDAHMPTVAPMPDEEGRHLPQGWRIVAGVVVVLLAYGGWHLLSTGSTQVAVPPPPSLNPPKAAPAKMAPRPTQTASAAASAPSPRTNPQTSPQANPTSAAAPPAGQANPPAGQANMSSLPAQPAVPKPASADNVSTIGTLGGTVYGAQNKNPRIVLKMKADSRVTVRGEDGSIYLNRDLKAGDSYFVPNLPGVYLATSNAGAIEVDLDGQVLGAVGQNQEVLGRVSLDPQSLVDRFNAH